MIILDTNVLSELMVAEPDPVVVAWLDRQPWTSVWTTAITVLEIRSGLQILPAGKRRASLIEILENILLQDIEQRVAPFDTAAESRAADLIASRQRKGRPGELRDTMIAGIVISRGAALATRNTRHFADLTVPLINPWTEKV